MAENKNLAIDLDKIVRSRAGDRIPGFVIRWLKRFLRVDFMNAFLVQGYEGLEFCEKGVEYLDVHPVVRGLENLDGFPEDTLFTFASNHPLGGIDGIIEAAVLGRRFPKQTLRFMVNDFLMALPGIRSQCVPVSKTGAQSRNLPAQVDSIFSSSDQVLVFPAGLCSRKYGGKIQDLPWRKTFIVKSRQYGRYIVPVHFKGQNSKRFYRFANFCKAMKFKFNFAMLLLPDEMYRGQHSTFEVVIGKPIPASFFDSSRTPLEWAEWMRQEVYKL